VQEQRSGGWVGHLIALFLRRVTGIPEGVLADTTRALNPVSTAHSGVLNDTGVRLGAVEATTVEPEGRASASMRTNALYSTDAVDSMNMRLHWGLAIAREHLATQRTQSARTLPRLRLL
jgi:hypothetical protein